MCHKMYHVVNILVALFFPCIICLMTAYNSFSNFSQPSDGLTVDNQIDGLMIEWMD